MKDGSQMRGVGDRESHLARAMDAEICAPAPLSLALQTISQINPRSATER